MDWCSYYWQRYSTPLRPVLSAASGSIVLHPLAAKAHVFGDDMYNDAVYI